MSDGVFIKLTTVDMTDHLGFGKEKRRESNLKILEGKVTFRWDFYRIMILASWNMSRDAFREMLQSVSQNGYSFEECKQVLHDSRYDKLFLLFNSLTDTIRYWAWPWIQRVLCIFKVGWYPCDNRFKVSCLLPTTTTNWHWWPWFVSSGMMPLIRAVLSNLLGEQANEIEIIANDAIVEPNGNWEIKYRHPTRWLLAQRLLHILCANCALNT